MHLAFASKPGTRALFTEPTNLFFFFSKIFIKNGSHCTIHTFKNYFTTVFLIFNNKRYPNRLLILIQSHKFDTTLHLLHSFPLSFFCFLVIIYFFNAEEKISCAHPIRPIFYRHVNFTCV